MSIFGDIWSKITSAATNAVSAATGTASDDTPAKTDTSGSASDSPPPAATSTTAATPAAMSNVDVETILAGLAAQKGNDENWRTSIVDLLKVLDLDSSLTARKALANELNVHAGEDGSAEQNIALHQAVIQKMEENGGKVPDSMKA